MELVTLSEPCDFLRGFVDSQPDPRGLPVEFGSGIGETLGGGRSILRRMIRRRRGSSPSLLQSLRQ